MIEPSSAREADAVDGAHRALPRCEALVQVLDFDHVPALHVRRHVRAPSRKYRRRAATRSGARGSCPSSVVASALRDELASAACGTQPASSTLWPCPRNVKCREFGSVLPHGLAVPRRCDRVEFAREQQRRLLAHERLRESPAARAARPDRALRAAAGRRTPCRATCPASRGSALQPRRVLRATDRQLQRHRDLLADELLEHARLRHAGLRTRPPPRRPASSAACRTAAARRHTAAPRRRRRWRSAYLDLLSFVSGSRYVTRCGSARNFGEQRIELRAWRAETLAAHGVGFAARELLRRSRARGCGRARHRGSVRAARPNPAPRCACAADSGAGTRARRACRTKCPPGCTAVRRARRGPSRGRRRNRWSCRSAGRQTAAISRRHARRVSRATPARPGRPSRRLRPRGSRSGCERPVPRWSTRITSRSRSTPRKAAATCGNDSRADWPGPPASITTGSGSGRLPDAAMRAIGNSIERPSGRQRSSGTRRRAALCGDRRRQARLGERAGFERDRARCSRRTAAASLARRRRHIAGITHCATSASKPAASWFGHVSVASRSTMALPANPNMPRRVPASRISATMNAWPFPIPPVTRTLLISNIAIFALQASLNPMLILNFALWPPASAQFPGAPSFEIWQLRHVRIPARRPERTCSSTCSRCTCSAAKSSGCWGRGATCHITSPASWARPSRS